MFRMQSALFPTLFVTAIVLWLIALEWIFVQRDTQPRIISLASSPPSIEESKVTEDSTRNLNFVPKIKIDHGLYSRLESLDWRSKNNVALETLSGYELSIQNAFLEKFSLKLIRNEDYETAEALLKRFSTSRRIESNTQFDYALVLSRQSKQTRAIDEYTKLIQAKPNYASAAINLGLLLKQQGDIKASNEVLQKAVSLSSGSKKAKSLSLLAETQIALNELEKAEQSYEDSISFKPDNAQSWFKLAEVQVKLRRPYSTVNLNFRRGLSLRPDYGLGWRRYGDYLLNSLNYRESHLAYTKALNYSGRTASIMSGLAWSAFENGQYQQALRYWTWLSRRAKSSELRLLGKHFVDRLSSQDSQLMALPTNPEMTYAKQRLIKDTKSWCQKLNQPTEHPRSDLASVKQCLHLWPLDRSLSWINAIRNDELFTPTLDSVHAEVFVTHGYIDLALSVLTKALNKAPDDLDLALSKSRLLIESNRLKELNHFLSELPEKLKNESTIQLLSNKWGKY